MEQHPYNLREEIPGETRLLIVGTAPPPRFSNAACGKLRPLDFDFYYGSEDNYMWEFLEKIAVEIEADRAPLFADEMPSDECCRAARSFLQRNGLWMRDVLQAYDRKVECSASDGDIVPAQFTEFRPVFDVSALAAIAFTSEQATAWTFQALADQRLGNFKDNLASWKKIKIREPSREQDIREKFQRPFLTTRIGQREIEFYVLPSPSPRGKLRPDDRLAIYRSVLFGKL